MKIDAEARERLQGIVNDLQSVDWGKRHTVRAIEALLADSSMSCLLQWAVLRESSVGRSNQP